MTPKEILLKAAELIEQPGKWTQGNFAMAIDGSGVVFCDNRATCFCAIGAIRRVGHDGNSMDEAFDAEELLEAYLPYGIVEFNDEPGREASEVADVMRRAAA